MASIRLTNLGHLVWVDVRQCGRPALHQHGWFEPIVPVVLGDPTFWVLITGVAEIAIGVGSILPWTRRYAALGSLVFLVGIYSANLNMRVNNIPLDGKTSPTTGTCFAWWPSTVGLSFAIAWSNGPGPWAFNDRTTA